MAGNGILYSKPYNCNQAGYYKKELIRPYF